MIKNKSITKLLFFFIFLLILFDLLGSAKITFDKTIFDFGEIKEEDGIVDGIFILTNSGDEPLVLQKVKPA